MCIFLTKYHFAISDYYTAFVTDADAKTYIDAVKSCRSKGGDIAMPESAEDNQKILDVVERDGGADFVWIGVQVIF